MFKTHIPVLRIAGREMKIVTTLAIWLGALTICVPVVADEVWDSSFGRVIYETDIGPTAIWSYRTEHHVGLINLAGLAGIHTNRGHYEGYWVQNDSAKRCNTVRPTQNGETSAYWGRFHITFIDKDFPSRWEAKWSYCNDEMEDSLWKGSPIVAGKRVKP